MGWPVAFIVDGLFAAGDTVTLKKKKIKIVWQNVNKTYIKSKDDIIVHSHTYDSNENLLYFRSATWNEVKWNSSMHNADWQSFAAHCKFSKIHFQTFIYFF